jgi:hypothetical protein
MLAQTRSGGKDISIMTNILDGAQKMGGANDHAARNFLE